MGAYSGIIIYEENLLSEGSLFICPFCYNQFVPLGVRQYAVGFPFGHKLLILNIFSYSPKACKVKA